jgi:hypothetical protein
MTGYMLLPRIAPQTPGLMQKHVANVTNIADDCKLAWTVHISCNLNVFLSKPNQSAHISEKQCKIYKKCLNITNSDKLVDLMEFSNICAGSRWKSLGGRWEVVGRSLGGRWEVVGGRWEVVGRSLGGS